MPVSIPQNYHHQYLGPCSEPQLPPTTANTLKYQLVGLAQASYTVT